MRVETTRAAVVERWKQEIEDSRGQLKLLQEGFDELQDMFLNPPKYIIDGQVVSVCPDRHHTYWHVVRQQVLAELAAPWERANVLREEATKEKKGRKRGKRKGRELGTKTKLTW